MSLKTGKEYYNRGICRTRQEVTNAPFSLPTWAAEFICRVSFGKGNFSKNFRDKLKNDWFIPGFMVGNYDTKIPEKSKDFSWDNMFQKIKDCFKYSKEFNYKMFGGESNIPDVPYLHVLHSVNNYEDSFLYICSQFLEFNLLTIPVAFTNDAMKKAAGLAAVQAERLKNKPTRDFFWLRDSCEEVLFLICRETAYSIHVATEGTPEQRIEYADISNAKLWDTEITYSESVDIHPVTQEYLNITHKRLKKAAEKYYKEIDIPKSYTQYTTEQPDTGLDFEKIKEYAPFIGLGLGIYRVLQG